MKLFLKRQIQLLKKNGLSEVYRKINILSLLVIKFPLFTLGALISIVIIIFCICLRKNLIVKKLICWRLGHFAGNTDFILNLIQDSKISKNDFLLFYYPCESCNDFLKSKIDESITTINKYVGVPLRWLSKFFFVDIIESDRDIYNLLDKYPPNFPLSKPEIDKGLKFLKSIGIESTDKWICLNVRDDSYLYNQSAHVGARVDWSYHDYRNCSISNYKEAAITLANLGYFVFRMGASVNEKFDVNHPRIFDYATNGMRTDFLDVFLGSSCTFAISNGTGFDALPYIYRRPILVC